MPCRWENTNCQENGCHVGGKIQTFPCNWHPFGCYCSLFQKFSAKQVWERLQKTGGNHVCHDAVRKREKDSFPNNIELGASNLCGNVLGLGFWCKQGQLTLPGKKTYTRRKEAVIGVVISCLQYYSGNKNLEISSQGYSWISNTFHPQEPNFIKLKLFISSLL